MSLKKKIPADEWKKQLQKQREKAALKKKFPSKFLFRRRTCGVCEDGICFQSVWVFHHEDEEEGGYGWVDEVMSYICKKCAPTREQLSFISLSFPKNMPKYEYRHWYY